MSRLLIRWIVMTISVYGASVVTQALKLGFVAQTKTPSDIVTLFIGVALLALLNATLGKILKFLTMPLSCLTLGLFSLVVNALVLWFAASFDLGFTINKTGFSGFLSAIVASVLISLINGALSVFVPDGKDD